MNIQQTRDMVRAALDGALEGVPTVTDPVFGVEVPTAVPGVPAEVLAPRATWADGDAYDVQARRLAAMFAENFERFAGRVSRRSPRRAHASSGGPSGAERQQRGDREAEGGDKAHGPAALLCMPRGIDRGCGSPPRAMARSMAGPGALNPRSRWR